MTPSEQFDARQKGIQAAMADLAMDSRFTSFIGAVREQREGVIDDICRLDILSNQQALLSCIGELRTYKSFLAIYEDARLRIAQRQADEEAKTE